MIKMWSGIGIGNEFDVFHVAASRNDQITFSKCIDTIKNNIID